MSVEFQSHKINAVIFDVDGTFYPHDIIPLIWGEVRQLQALYLLQISGQSGPFSPAEIEAMQNLYVTRSEASGSFTATFTEMGGNDGVLLQMVKSVDRRKFLDPDPELTNMLNLMRTSLKLGILTSGTEFTTANTCGSLLGTDWQLYFHNIHCYDTPDVNWHKPQPEAFRHILVTLGVEPDQSLMVGDDHKADLIPAKSLGMFTIQVGRTDDPGVDLHLEKVTDLPNHLIFS